MGFNDVVIFICCALTVYLLVREVKRTDKSRLVSRILANVLMVICFAFLIIPITYSIQKQDPADEINLLTDGTSLDTIAKINGAKYDLDSNLFSNRKHAKVNHLADLNYFLVSNPAIKKVNIYGNGLADEELKKLKDYEVSFHPANIPDGVISASWQKQLKFSESLNVQGVYNNSSNKSIQLKLFGLGANLDSVIVKPNSKVNFSFVNQPKQDGKAVFNLVALQGNDTLSNEPVPFFVEKKQPIKILILASFPDFEYKFLKKWLYENQYAVAVRNQISKNKYSTDFLNIKAVSTNQINQALLKNFDAVIIDEDEFAAISSIDKSSIYSEVNNGMGLIVRVTNPTPLANGQNFNQYEALSTGEKPLSLKAIYGLKFANLTYKQTLFLKSSANDQSIITDENEKILANIELNGLGKVLKLAFSSSYQWQLAGKQIDYSRFWSFLLDKTIRKKVADQSFTVTPQFPSIDEQTRIIVNLSNNKTPAISFNETKIALRQNMELPFEWDGYLWSKIAGWQSLSVNQKTENLFFYKKTDWNTAKKMIKQKNTSNFVANQSVNYPNTTNAKFLAQETINKWYFFFGFLFTISFLWYELRFLVNK